MKKSFDGEISNQIPISDLILFSIYSVNLKKEKCNFERLIKETFSLFPENFGFDKYPQWPDARKLDRPLRALRMKRMIEGNPATFFTLTRGGLKLAEEIAKVFRQRKLFK